MRERAADLAPLLDGPERLLLRLRPEGMEEGVVLALRDVAEGARIPWDTLGAALKREGRLHLETY